MIRRLPLTLCCALLYLPVAAAQTRGAAADTISGTWKGELNVPDSRPVAITLALKFDGKSAVTGTFSGLPRPGNVKRGTFNAKTGALKLELGRADAAAVLIVLDGAVTKTTATGKMTGEPGAGTFTLTKQAAGPKK